MNEKFIPKEGDIVKVQVTDSEFKRDYMLVIWPNQYLISLLNTSRGKHVSALSNFIINLNGEFSHTSSFGFSVDNDSILKPNVNDMFEVSRVLRENGLRYNLKTKKLIKI